MNEKRIILLIPPLIRTGNIFTIGDGGNFVEFLVENHFIVEMMNFNYTVDDVDITFYVEQITIFARKLKQKYDQELILLGYCLGGVISALACHTSPDLFNILITISAPWSFRDTAIKRLYNDYEKISYLKNYCITNEMLSAAFHLISPPRKSLDKKIQNWLDDMTPISSSSLTRIIQDLITEKYNSYQIIKSAIHVYGIYDKIVDADLNASYCEDYFKNALIIKNETGHIGFFTSERRVRFWRDLVHIMNKILHEEQKDKKVTLENLCV